MGKTRMFGTYEQIQRRCSILVGSKWEDRGDLLKALQRVNDIRKRFSRKCKRWNSTAEIRRWRNGK